MGLGQRKTVTVLFSDLVESTAMAEQIDAEALSDLLARYFGAMRTIIERHGGRVEKFIGDAVVGMFGVPSAHEDDALRAIRAAVEMHAAIAALNEETGPLGGVVIAARIGINTGEVLVSGDPSSGDGGMALGHAINMAARMEQVAGPGDVLVGARTLELVGGTVDVEPAGPIAVKGASAPIEAWRVKGVREGSTRGWGAPGAFVGREAQLASIESALTTATRDRACVVATVVAPPGMGKSRLASEALRRMDGRATVLVGRCRPYGEGVTYAPLIEMAASESLPADNAQVVRTRQTLANAVLASPDETAWAFKQLLDTLAEHRPVVAVVDDLHWAEQLLVGVLEYVATFSVDRPILLLCLARPDVYDTHPGWAIPRPNSATIRLDPLTRDETEALLDADESTSTDPELRKRIVGAAGGVPLFVEQMAALSSEGAGGVPPNVRALLAARVDRLLADERIVMEAAAVQGETFDRPTVAALASGGEAPLGATLIGLVRREFLRPERSVDGGERFRFSHALLRDAVYEQMPRRMRSDLHERYADLLASAHGDPEVIGHHLERAHAESAQVNASDSATGVLAQRAGVVLHGAGKWALARKEWQHAHDLLQRARRLLAHESSDEVRVLPDLLQATAELSGPARAAELYAEAITAAQKIGDLTTELRTEIAWAQIQIRRGDAEMRERAPDIAERAAHHFAEIGDESHLASTSLLKIASRTMPIGRQVEMMRAAQAHAERTGDERAQIEIWDELGGSMIFGPTPYPEILEFGRREMAWARERGIAFAEADGSLAEAYALAASGETETARHAIANVRERFAQLPGFVSQLGETDILAASVELHAGDVAAAEAFYRRAMDVLDKGGHVPWWTAATLGLVHLLIDSGRPKEAEDVLTRLDQRGLLWSAGERTSYVQARAKLAAAAGDFDLALRLAREAVEAVSDVDTPQYAAGAHELVGNLLAQMGDDSSATAELNLAYELYSAKGYRPGQLRLRPQSAS